MSKFNKTLLFLNIAIVVVIIVVFVAHAFTNPSANPPSGGGALYYYNGNLGIGTNTPSYPLTVSSSTDPLFGLVRSGATYPTIFKLGTDSALVINSGNSDTLTLKSGNVGIGVTNPGTAKLKISGGVLDMSSQNITNVLDPVNNQDAATKAWVLANAGGVTYKGRTATSYTGNLGGIAGANAKCQIDYSGSHMCRQSEMLASGATNFGDIGWVSCESYNTSMCVLVTNSFYYTGGSVDCSEWSAANCNDVGPHVTATGVVYITTGESCCTARPIHCCK